MPSTFSKSKPANKLNYAKLYRVHSTQAGLVYHMIKLNVNNSRNKFHLRD